MRIGASADRAARHFDGVLTARNGNAWSIRASVDARIVTSFAISPHLTAPALTRSASPSPSPTRLVPRRPSLNEPNLTAISGAPPGFDAVAYGRDFKGFRGLARQAAPGMMILGPGAAGEGAGVSNLLAASGPGLDAISYHHYGMVSERCGGAGTPQAALSEDWLSRTDKTLAFYRSLRDQFEPGKPIWLTETAEAACGGNRWAATFLDTFRYLDQLGRLAKAGVQVVMHNTLAASDYGLLDERTLEPRPNYWGALLWRQLMGTTVLDPGLPIQAGLHVYAHCRRGMPGGVTLLVINTDRGALD